MCQELYQLNSLFEAGEIKYRATNAEIIENVEVSPVGHIYLAVDNLNDVTKYGQVRYPASFVDPPSISQWYSNNPPAARVDELRIEQYPRKLAHEMQHIYFRILNLEEYVKWKLMIRAIDVSECYPGNQCSVARGHEFMNPDGIQSCNREEEYDPPQTNSQ